MATKVLVSFPSEFLAEVDRIAREEHRSRSELLREAMRLYSVMRRGERRLGDKRKEDSMGKILCATRGGEASYHTQDAAIALAQERGDGLLFLYVVDIGFLNKTGRAVRPDVVTAEMEKMGEFLLAMAQERAQKQGVEAGYVLCHGDLRRELKAVAREEVVDLVVLGQPAGTGSAFVPADLEAFAAEIEAETGVKVRLI